MSNNHSDTASSTMNTPDSYAHSLSNDKKYSIIVDFEGAKGKDAAKWSSRCGVLIRRHIPVGYPDWRQVDEVYKDNLWKELMKEFEMNIDPKLARPFLEKKFSQYYRTMKSLLRTKYLRKDGQTIPKSVAIDNRPNDIDKVWWEKFIDIEYSDKKKQQCMKNAEIKAKNTITHTLGRKSYCRLYEEMAMEDPEQKFSRATFWKVGHKNRKTGKVLPCAAERYALVEAAEEKQKLEARLNDSDGVASLEDLENDPVAEVFGSDKGKSFCRAVSSTSSLKQVKMTLAGKAIADRKAKEELRIWKEETQNQVNDAIKSMSSAFLNLQQNMLQGKQNNQFESNMIIRVETPSNMDHASSTSSLKQVKMTSAGQAIAGRKAKDELRIWKEEIQNQVNDAIKSMTSAFLNLQQNMLQGMQHNQLESNTTIRVETPSNSERASSNSPTDILGAPTNEVETSSKTDNM